MLCAKPFSNNLLNHRTMAKHTLLATTGASPQVITETLWAIHDKKQQWPDDIFLITTSFGKGKAVKGLIEDGHLQRLCDELRRPMPAFNADHVLVTPGAGGVEVEDARSLPDHEALANFIMTEVRNRTAGTDTSLHASLAGGRKTMTFYIGYAMSLFGRVQDTLSHVLVSEGYETVPGFWFPTNSEPHRHLENRGGALDASQAEITLAPIPFIRHRRNLPQVLLQNSETVQFAELVQLINLGENPDGLRLVIDLPANTIQVQNENCEVSIAIQLGLLELAFYTMMARATLKEETDLTRPSKQKPDTALAPVLLAELLPICGLDFNDNLKLDIAKLEDWNFKNNKLKDDTLESLKEGLAQNWFDSRKNKISRAFAAKLPDSLVRWVTPTIIWADDGNRLPDSDIDKITKGGGYGIPLKFHQISIIDALKN